MVKLSEIVTGVKRTELLYWFDSYLRTFNAKALKVHREGKRNVYVILDRTAFHPKSGGQPSDTGTISSDDFTIQIRKIMQIQNITVHWGKILEGIPETRNIIGEIDWNQRYQYMKRHTAGHLLDHCLSTTLGYHVKTTDSWLGDPCYVGYEGKAPQENVLLKTQQMENYIIKRGGEVNIEIIPHDSLLARAPEAPNIYRLPQLENYRIVTIEGCDPIPCGGCHIKNITEIGSFNILNVTSMEESFRVYYEVGSKTD